MNKAVRIVTIIWVLICIATIVVSIFGIKDLQESSAQAAEDGRSNMGAAASGLILFAAIVMAALSIIDSIIILVCMKLDVNKTLGVIIGFLAMITTCIVPGAFLVAYSCCKKE